MAEQKERRSFPWAEVVITVALVAMILLVTHRAPRPPLDSRFGHWPKTNQSITVPIGG